MRSNIEGNIPPDIRIDSGSYDPEQSNAEVKFVTEPFNTTEVPRIRINDYQNGCGVHRHIAFLKTHKTGR